MRRANGDGFTRCGEVKRVLFRIICCRLAFCSLATSDNTLPALNACTEKIIFLQGAGWAKCIRGGLRIVMQYIQPRHAGAGGKCTTLREAQQKRSTGFVGTCHGLDLPGLCAELTQRPGCLECPSQALYTLTAHFLKSCSLDMGQVASSVTLLINTDSSKKGTKV